ncbi:Peptidyl-prolyl cis-trans isomerase fpr2 [Mycoblastus sanguinarius]|nr:Peptidyl-prolyl cis-trans isomerase fpr2 [Mycoblastus sanguinarius]
MRLPTPLALLLALLPPALTSPSTVTTTHIHRTSCSRPTRRGDSISVHYRGTLQSDGSEFDTSYKRGQPLTFTVGKGQVIKGWDEGLLEMCVGDKRVLTIPPEFGYGERGMGPIPGGSTLVFETELVGIEGVGKGEGEGGREEL